MSVEATLCNIQSKDKCDVTHLVPAIQVSCLCEVGIPARRSTGTLPNGTARWFRRVVPPLISRPTLAWPILDPQDLTNLGQRNNEGMIAQSPLSRCPCLPCTHRRRDMVHRHRSWLGRRTWLAVAALPSVGSRPLSVQRADVRQVKPPTEITSGRGVGNTFGAQSVR